MPGPKSSVGRAASVGADRVETVMEIGTSERKD